jgi:hypothetical protein
VEKPTPPQIGFHECNGDYALIGPPRTTKWGSVQGNRYNAEFKVPTGREVAIKDLDLPTGITVRNAAQQRAQQFCG